LADVVNQVPEGGRDDADKLALPPIQGAVRFDHVSFRFGNKGPLNLNDVNLTVEPGEFIGIVGLSGSGKSTLMKLLDRLYEPDEGRILVDGLDIAKVQLSSLRTQVGMVPQDSLLFEGTVAENISLNNPEIDSERIVEAAKLACAHDFIMDLPAGYASRVSERGANLSGGQRQRLAIARMVLENPALLVMDEATSALDADTERRVCQNLQQRFRDETVFFITHRLATVMQADRIILMDQGRVMEMGSPEELIQSRGLFYALWTQQS
jgi:ATP-binding cassette subfamily B protein